MPGNSKLHCLSMRGQLNACFDKARVAKVHDKMVDAAVKLFNKQRTKTGFFTEFTKITKSWIERDDLATDMVLFFAAKFLGTLNSRGQGRRQRTKPSNSIRGFINRYLPTLLFTECEDGTKQLRCATYITNILVMSKGFCKIQKPLLGKFEQLLSVIAKDGRVEIRLAAAQLTAAIFNQISQDTDSKFYQIFLDLMDDPDADVRCAIITAIKLTPVTLDHVIGRTIDVMSEVKVCAFKALSKADFDSFTTEQRMTLLARSMRPSDARVFLSFREVFFEKWLEDKQNNVLDVLKGLDIYNSRLTIFGLLNHYIANVSLESNWKFFTHPATVTNVDDFSPELLFFWDFLLMCTLKKRFQPIEKFLFPVKSNLILLLKQLDYTSEKDEIKREELRKKLLLLLRVVPFFDREDSNTWPDLMSTFINMMISENGKGLVLETLMQYCPFYSVKNCESFDELNWVMHDTLFSLDKAPSKYIKNQFMEGKNKMSALKDQLIKARFQQRADLVLKVQEEMSTVRLKIEKMSELYGRYKDKDMNSQFNKINKIMNIAVLLCVYTKYTDSAFARSTLENASQRVVLGPDHFYANESFIAAIEFQIWKKEHRMDPDGFWGFMSKMIFLGINPSLKVDMRRLLDQELRSMRRSIFYSEDLMGRNDDLFTLDKWAVSACRSLFQRADRSLRPYIYDGLFRLVLCDGFCAEKLLVFLLKASLGNWKIERKYDTLPQMFLKYLKLLANDCIQWPTIMGDTFLKLNMILSQHAEEDENGVLQLHYITREILQLSENGEKEGHLKWEAHEIFAVQIFQGILENEFKGENEKKCIEYMLLIVTEMNYKVCNESKIKLLLCFLDRLLNETSDAKHKELLTIGRKKVLGEADEKILPSIKNTSFYLMAHRNAK